MPWATDGSSERWPASTHDGACNEQGDPSTTVTCRLLTVADRVRFHSFATHLSRGVYPNGAIRLRLTPPFIERGPSVPIGETGVNVSAVTPRVQTMRLPSRPAAVAASQRRAVCTTPPPPESVNPTSAHPRAEFVGDCVGRDRREADIDAEDAAIDPGARRFAVKALEKRAFRDFSPVRHEDIAALSEPGGCSSCEGFASRIDCPLRRPQVRLEARLRAEQVTPPAHATASSPSSCDDSRLPHRPGVGRLLADGPTSGTQTATCRSAPSCQGSYRYSVENPEVSLERSRAMYWDVATEDS